MKRHLLNSSLVLLFFLFVMVGKAYAYLDPGSGSFIFQLVLGALLGFSLMIKIYWKRMKDSLISFFSKKEKKKAKK